MKPLLKGREKYSDYTKEYVENLYKVSLTFAKLSEYNKIRKAIGEKELTLKSDEYILNCDYGNLIPMMEKAASDKQKLTLDGKTYKIKYVLQKDTYMVTAAKTDMGTVILNDDIIRSLKIDHSTLYLNLNWKGNAQKVSEQYNEHLKQMIANSKMPNSPYSATFSKEEVYEQSTGLSTIMTYIAIYIGLVFLITCAAVQSLIIVIVIYIGYMIATYFGSKSMLKEK